jgi:hypothetical protein
VRRPLAWLLGVVAVARFLRRRREAPPAPDPRAEELRRKLDESRSPADAQEELVGEDRHGHIEEPLADDPASRRRAVHEAGRAAAQRMRGT